MSAALLAAAAIVAPLILLRGRAIRRYFAIAIGGSLAFALLAAAARPLRVAADPHLVAVSFGVLLAAAFGLCVALREAPALRGGAGRPALGPGLFYAAQFPRRPRGPIDGDEP